MTTLTLKSPPSCRYCGESIRWKNTPTGFVPLSAGGRDHRETCTGFQGLDGADFKHIPGIHSGQLLFANRPVRLSLTVRPDSIELTCDGSSVLQWKGDPKRFIPYSRWRIPDRDKLFLCSGTAVKFHEMTLTPLTDASP